MQEDIDVGSRDKDDDNVVVLSSPSTMASLSRTTNTNRCFFACFLFELFFPWV